MKTIDELVKDKQDKRLLQKSDKKFEKFLSPRNSADNSETIYLLNKLIKTIKEIDFEVKIPEIKIPAIPEIKAPEIKLPDIKLPDMPKIDPPKIPPIKIPDVKVELKDKEKELKEINCTYDERGNLESVTEKYKGGSTIKAEGFNTSKIQFTYD